MLHLSAPGTSLLLDDASGAVLPVLYWGGELGGEGLVEIRRALEPALASSAADVTAPVSLLPERSSGHRGRPGLSGGRAGVHVPTALRTVRRQDHGSAIRVEARDRAAGLSVEIGLVLHLGGVLEVRAGVTNEGPEPYALEHLTCALPLPERARELLDLTGRWSRERHPQRHGFVDGAFVRELRHGRTGHDSPLVLCAGTPGFTNRTGEVWGVHLAWSGDAAYRVERGPGLSPLLMAGELLEAGEVVLEQGQRYDAPVVLAAYSARGLDGLTAAFHRHMRARPSHPSGPRPVVLNTWEAVYFDHDLARLSALADAAAEVGVERFVLDDGWFLGRRDDTRGLGDWTVDPAVWPDGLAPLVEHVTGLGMQFGLWVEPEMVNVDSELARAHPDWLLGVPDRMPPAWRRQQVLDLSRPEAFDHVLSGLDALLAGHDISALKWDHNRDLVEATDAAGRPAVHRQTSAAYALLDELRARHPGVEIESCASGGGRVDLGILARTDRVWASDTNDPLERQTIQRWTGLLLPPELIGAHVGPVRSHTTGRRSTLAFRVATALFGSMGVEWDLTAVTPEERAGLAEAITAHKRLRSLLHGGEAVHGDLPDASAQLHGVVALDGSAALFGYVQLSSAPLEVPAPVQLPGLAPDRTYAVRPLLLAGGPVLTGRGAPPWYDDGELVLSGRALGMVGVRVPLLAPEQCLLLELQACASSPAPDDKGLTQVGPARPE